jgi:hypothetical protein
LWRRSGALYIDGVSLPRALVLGLLAAFVLVLALVAGDGLPEECITALAVLPVVVLAAAGMFDRGAAGWPWRLARGLVGTVLAGVAGLAAMRVLLEHADWFRVGDWLVAVILIALSGSCGGIAAAAARPSRGFALAWGFILGFVALMLPSAFLGDARAWGFIVGFVFILGTGAIVGALLGKFAR